MCVCVWGVSSKNEQHLPRVGVGQRDRLSESTEAGRPGLGGGGLTSLD